MKHLLFAVGSQDNLFPSDLPDFCSPINLTFPSVNRSHVAHFIVLFNCFLAVFAPASALFNIDDGAPQKIYYVCNYI